MLRMSQLKAKNMKKNKRSTANLISLWLIFFLQLSFLTTHPLAPSIYFLCEDAGLELFGI